MVSPAPSAALERALAELYGAAPEEFVLVRSRLERELRDAGATAAATEVRGRRRPNLAAWACNQLARRDADEVAALLDATRRVIDAQAAVGPGGGAAALRDAARARHELLDRLADAGVAVLRGRAPTPATYRASIAATLDAASADPDRSPDLRAGRLTRPLAPPAGFGPLVAPAGPPPAARDVTAGREAARRALADARREATARTAGAKTVASELASAVLRADAATAHLREVERALERARASVAETAGQAQAAQARADEARAAVDEADERVRDAEARTREPGRPARRRP